MHCGRIPSPEVYKHRGLPPDFLSTMVGVAGVQTRLRPACLEIRVQTTSCTLSPPRKYLGEAGWGEAKRYPWASPESPRIMQHEESCSPNPFYQLCPGHISCPSREEETKA